MIVRCKAFVTNVNTTEYGQTTVNLQLAYSQTPGTENYQFHAASPSGNLKLTYNKPQNAETDPTKQFVAGSWWYIDTERVDGMDSVNHERFCWLSGIEHMAGYYYNHVQKEMVKQQPGAIRAKCRGFFDGVNFDSDIYIANEAVFAEFGEIGTLYNLLFTKTTKL